MFYLLNFFPTAFVHDVIQSVDIEVLQLPLFVLKTGKKHVIVFLDTLKRIIEHPADLGGEFKSFISLMKKNMRSYFLIYGCFFVPIQFAVGCLPILYLRHISHERVMAYSYLDSGYVAQYAIRHNNPSLLRFYLKLRGIQIFLTTTMRRSSNMLLYVTT